MRLIVTIDTEEDNWLGYECSEYTTQNAARLPALQQLFDECGVRPTYLLTHVMASDPTAVEFLRDVHEDGRCEIGAHCHPWNTPPLREVRSAVNSMLCNLPPSLQYEKLRTLTDWIIECFGIRPTSFRAGRWGYDKEVGLNLLRLGYRVDSSITPYIDWSSEHGPDFSSCPLEPSWPTLRDVFVEAPPHALIEVPATVGYLQRDFARAARLQQRLLRQPFLSVRLHGLLYRLGWLNRVWLCPEHHPVKELIALTDVLRGKHFPIVNLMFHSPTLQAGLTPFVGSKAEERAFLTKIREYLEYATSSGLEFVTLHEGAMGLNQPRNGDSPATPSAHAPA